MAGAAKPPDFVTQVDEDDIEVSDTVFVSFLLLLIIKLGDDW